MDIEIKNIKINEMSNEDLGLLWRIIDDALKVRKGQESDLQEKINACKESCLIKK